MVQYLTFLIGNSGKALFNHCDLQNLTSSSSVIFDLQLQIIRILCQMWEILRLRY